jgi:DNA modification methylase
MWQIIQGNNVDHLRQFPDNHFDSIVTDPPYGIDFLGKAWDANTGALETYQECLRVLKPGGHILAFSAARTYHHLAVTIEQAGFEIRDQIMWIYSSGFPKSQDIGKSIDRQSGKAAHKAELSEVKAILRQLYEESGKSTAEISRECGFNAGGYLKTDFKDKGWANNLPRDDKWLTLKSVLGCGDEYDDYFVTTPQVKIGEKESGCFDQEFDNYTIGARSKTVDVTVSQTEAGKQWSGWGTQLKPAHEPICLARKPIKLSIAKNCQQWGVGALNIDATRIPTDELKPVKVGKDPRNRLRELEGDEVAKRDSEDEMYVPNEAGRFPSNVLGDIPDYQKYFYCPKVGRAERHIGHETPPPMFGDQKGAYDNNGERYAVGFDARSVETRTEALHSIGGYWCNDKGERLNEKEEAAKMAFIPGIGKIYAHGVGAEVEKFRKENNIKPGNVGNNHPTVKPIELMKYLIKLVTPPGGHVLDPFNGSGSTGCAAVELDYDYTGIELDPAYVEIAQRRIQAWYDSTHATTFTELFTDA